MILLYTVILVIGFLALVKGSDIFVNGSSELAKSFHVPSLIIGLTIVAFGTSAPELAVSTLAAFQGSNEIALSNVIGSNIFNLLGVLGVSAAIYPLPVDKHILKRDFPFSIITTGVLLSLSSVPSRLGERFAIPSPDQNIGTITGMTGLFLVVCFAGYTAFLIYTAIKQPVEDPGTNNKPAGKCILQIITGLVLVIAGGQAVVYGAKEIARAAGMTETLIGLTIVAIGTSLPELVTSVTAARKGETELAVGNALGSNIFNLLLILGVSAIIHPLSVNGASLYDLIILLLTSILAFTFALSAKRLARPEGIIMITLYMADIIFAVLR